MVTPLKIEGFLAELLENTIDESNKTEVPGGGIRTISPHPLKNGLRVVLDDGTKFNLIINEIIDEAE